jgi:hypothetical protein
MADPRPGVMGKISLGQTVCGNPGGRKLGTRRDLTTKSPRRAEFSKRYFLLGDLVAKILQKKEQRSSRVTSTMKTLVARP